MTETEQSSYFGNAFAEAAYRRTYARFVYDLGRREEWEETVDRVTDFLDTTAEGKLTRDEVKEIHDAILHMKVLPSMRALAMGTDAIRQNAIALYNCFGGMTTFVTRSGLRTLSGAEGETVEVLAADGEWREAEVRSFGIQKLQRVTLEHYNGGKHGTYLHHVEVTSNHRWLLKDGTETTALRVGDKLRSPDLSSSVTDVPLVAVQHGFFYGDGTLNNVSTKPFAQMRLCGAKNQHADTLFGEFNRSYPPSCNGDAMVYCGTANVYWKELPTRADPLYVAGFIRGLFLADGSTTDGGNICIGTQNADLAEWLKTFSGLAGYKVLSTRVYNNDTNYGKRSAPLHMITMGKGDSAVLRVIAIEDLGVEEDVYCVVEPETHTFTLGNGQVTGNCSYLPVDSLDAFSETLYILMAGTGVGFSVERRYVEQLPKVKRQRHTDEHPETWTILDTTEGWADALKVGLQHWFSGSDVNFDYSLIRPSGTPLRTKGGRASGPEPLMDLLTFVRNIVLGAQGRKLTTLECLDVQTKVASVVVVGGVRRSSEISLSDLDDDALRDAKVGQFWLEYPHRSLSNNSAVYEVKPTWEVFKKEWDSLANSGTGERGIFNRQSLRKNRPERRKDAVFGGNPCLEICLRPYSFCNLSEVVARADDTYETLHEKVRLATIIGTVQSMVTDFPYLRPIWKQNAEEERLLGVSVTGQMDCPVWRENDWIMRDLRQLAIDTNKEYAERLGIPQSAAITCTKPSGTASSVVDSAPGIHTRYSQYYIRRMRVSTTDPILRVFKHYNVPMNPEVGQEPDTANTWVVEFPVKAPEGSITRRDITAIEQIKFWLRVKRNWAEHTISCTVYVENGAWDEVGAFVYENFDDITGLSFLPKDDFVYQLAPYEEITQERYAELSTSFPKISYGLLRRYEKLGYNEATREYSCVGDKCDII